MKLRNKKTGETWMLIQHGEGIYNKVWLSNGYQRHEVKTLAELVAGWEDIEES